MEDKEKLEIIAVAEIYGNGESVLKNKNGKVIAELSECSPGFINYIKKTEKWERNKLNKNK